MQKPRQEDTSSKMDGCSFLRNRAIGADIAGVWDLNYPRSKAEKVTREN